MTSILLLSCYELGHQPLSLAWPLAVLQQAGFAAVGVDLAVQPFPHELVKTAEFIAIAVPMHTALRLGVQTTQQIRRLNPQAHICFYGLYAWLNADYLLHQPADSEQLSVNGGQYPLADSVIAGEYEQPLVELVQSFHSPFAIHHSPHLHIGRFPLPVPSRQTLAPLDQYARYVQDGQAHIAGYVEASRGCLHTCRHCPVVPVYNGRFFIIPLSTVMADIRQQVAAGARHITFGDPDFLNGPGHALKITRALHVEFPNLTFDFTTKVEHLLKHRHLLPELRQLGASFVVSAFEATSNQVLTHLEKGHTLADMETVLDVLQAVNLPVQPTWVPFTPWTTLGDYLEMLTWIRLHDLIPHVPVVQLSIRLLVPPGSVLLNHPDAASWCGQLDAPNFTYQWTHPDPCMDELQKGVTRLAETASDDPYLNFAAVEKLAYRFAGKSVPKWKRPFPPPPAPPRLTEDWFC